MDEGTAKLYAKYWGNGELVNNDGFWEDIYEYYSHEYCDAPLPLEYNPTTVRMVLDLLDCPPRKCGKCCRYNKLKLRPTDIQKITDNTSYTMKDLGLFRDSGKTYMDCSNGCMFLKDNSCTIHKFRPDACFFFPIGSKDVVSGGRDTKQMIIRIKCPTALDIARKVITEAMSKDNLLLLPDLTIIPR